MHNWAYYGWLLTKHVNNANNKIPNVILLVFPGSATRMIHVPRHVSIGEGVDLLSEVLVAVVFSVATRPVVHTFFSTAYNDKVSD